MAVKNLLIAYGGSESSDVALDFALMVRDKYDAHATGLLAHNFAPVNQNVVSWIPEDIQKSIKQAQAQATKNVGTQFKERTASSSAPDKVHWISKSGDADDTVARYARHYDMTILGRYDAVGSEDQQDLHPDKIAMVSGRPVMLVPRKFDRSAFNEHVVVAWDGRRASSRALADAMQILETTSRVTIVSVADGAELALPEINVETALQRHGMNAEKVILERNGKSIGERILEFLDQAQPNLLVMGAYEHSKFRQSIVGGVTSIVLKNAKVPIIVSH